MSEVNIYFDTMDDGEEWGVYWFGPERNNLFGVVGPRGTYEMTLDNSARKNLIKGSESILDNRWNRIFNDKGFKVCSSNETTATVRYTQQTINVDRVENDHQALLRLVKLCSLSEKPSTGTDENVSQSQIHAKTKDDPLPVGRRLPPGRGHAGGLQFDDDDDEMITTETV